MQDVQLNLNLREMRNNFFNISMPQILHTKNELAYVKFKFHWVLCVFIC